MPAGKDALTRPLSPEDAKHMSDVLDEAAHHFRSAAECH
jgi:hypothetical protein